MSKDKSLDQQQGRDCGQKLCYDKGVLSYRLLTKACTVIIKAIILQYSNFNNDCLHTNVM